MADHSASTRRAPATDRRDGGVRAGAKALVRSSDRALLVRERHADGTPFWTLPGGGVHVHESTREALHRELREELGCRAAVGGRVATFWYGHSNLRESVSAYRVFDCALLSRANPNPGEGVLDAKWVTPRDPPASTLPQVRYLLERV